MCFRLVIPHKICTKEDFLLQVFPQQHSISLDIVFLFSLQAGEGISMVKDESLPWLTEKSKKNEKKGKTRTRLSAKRYSERQTWWFLMKKRKSMKKWVKVRMDKKVNASLIQKDTNIMICGPMPNHIVPLSTFTRKLVRIFGSLAQLWIINGIGGNFVVFAWINLMRKQTTHGNRFWIPFQLPRQCHVQCCWLWQGVVPLTIWWWSWWWCWWQCCRSLHPRSEEVLPAGNRIICPSSAFASSFLVRKNTKISFLIARHFKREGTIIILSPLSWLWFWDPYPRFDIEAIFCKILMIRLISKEIFQQIWSYISRQFIGSFFSYLPPPSHSESTCPNSPFLL